MQNLPKIPKLAPEYEFDIKNAPHFGPHITHIWIDGDSFLEKFFELFNGESKEKEYDLLRVVLAFHKHMEPVTRGKFQSTVLYHHAKIPSKNYTSSLRRINLEPEYPEIGGFYEKLTGKEMTSMLVVTGNVNLIKMCDGDSIPFIKPSSFIQLFDSAIVQKTNLTRLTLWYWLRNEQDKEQKKKKMNDSKSPFYQGGVRPATTPRRTDDVGLPPLVVPKKEGDDFKDPSPKKRVGFVPEEKNDEWRPPLQNRVPMGEPEVVRGIYRWTGYSSSRNEDGLDDIRQRILNKRDPPRDTRFDHDRYDDRRVPEIRDGPRDSRDGRSGQSLYDRDDINGRDDRRDQYRRDERDERDTRRDTRRDDGDQYRRDDPRDVQEKRKRDDDYDSRGDYRRIDERRNSPRSNGHDYDDRNGRK